METLLWTAGNGNTCAEEIRITRRYLNLDTCTELNRTPGNIREEFARFQMVAKHVGGLVPQAQAARILGLSKQRINDLVAGGRLREHDFFGKNFIACSDIEKFQGLKRPSGRPKKTIDESM